MARRCRHRVNIAVQRTHVYVHIFSLFFVVVSLSVCVCICKRLAHLLASIFKTMCKAFDFQLIYFSPVLCMYIEHRTIIMIS